MINWLLEQLGLLLLGVFLLHVLVYTITRMVAMAWFRTKQEYDNHHLRTMLNLTTEEKAE